MKLAPLAFLSLSLAATGASQEKPTPQPRVRLDAAARATASAPAPVAKVESSSASTSPVATTATSPVTTMAPLIVSERPVLTTGPARPLPPPEKFNPLDGGGFVKRDVGGLRFEVGLWPHEDIMADDARFKPKPNQANVSVLRVTW